MGKPLAAFSSQIVRVLTMCQALTWVLGLRKKQIKQRERQRERENNPLLSGLYSRGEFQAAFQIWAAPTHVEGEPMKPLAHISPCEPMFEILFTLNEFVLRFHPSHYL